MEKIYRPGSASFESHYLEFSPDRIQVKPTWKTSVFLGIFALIGVAVMTIPFWLQLESDKSIWGVLGLGFAFLSSGVGGIILELRRKHPLINLYQRVFYPVGKNERALPENIPSIPLEDIKEISLSSSLVSAADSYYRCYTLKLKCSENREFTLLHHGNLDAFMRDAQKLSDRLGIPLTENILEAANSNGSGADGCFLLIFSLFWLGLCGFIHWQSWKNPEIFSIVFSGIFVLAGLVMFVAAIKLLVSDSRK